MAMKEISYEEIIGRVRVKLRCGSERISNTPGPLRWSWWPEALDFEDELLSDYGVDTNPGTLEKEFREEVAAIREVLEELGHEIKLGNWQDGSTGPARKLYVSMNRVADALSVWDQIGVPIRCRGNIVYKIWAPRDVFGSPIIKALPIDAFIIGVAEQTAADCVEKFRVQSLLEKWRVAAIILAVLVIMAAVGWLF